MIVYDAEIIRLVPPKDPNSEQWVNGAEYCDGWHDFKGMGISCLCAIELTCWRPYVFLGDNLDRFEHLAATHKTLCGWNNRRFDNPLMEAHGIFLPWEERTWDLQEELIRAANPPSPFTGEGRGGGSLLDDINKNYRDYARGRSLDAVSRANLDGGGKSGTGWMAPIDWQAGRAGKVISYCLNDVFQTAMLAMKIVRDGGLFDPVTLDHVPINPPECR